MKDAMTTINEKLGLRRAGTRRMMKLPKDREARNDLTRAQCPQCGQRGVTEYTTRGDRMRACTWCAHRWPV